jgi:FixJ family two-component response regulator
MLANAAGFLEKPFTPSRLLDAVADALVADGGEAGGTRASRSTRDRPPVK